MFIKRNYWNNPRVFEAGFYDDNGVWFATWERDWPDKEYNYGCAETFSFRPTHIRYTREGKVYGEMPISVYEIKGLPD